MQCQKPTMMIKDSLLALCVFHFIVLESNAFFVLRRAPLPSHAIPFKSNAWRETNSACRDLKASATNGSPDEYTQSRAAASTNRAHVKGGALRNAASANGSRAHSVGPRPSVSLWGGTSPAITIQGGSIETWSFPSPAIERVQVILESDGRPVNGRIDLWQGPDNAPQIISVFLEDGTERPFCAIVETPGGSNAVAVRNTGNLEFPLIASVEPDRGFAASLTTNISDQHARKVQGGAVYAVPIGASIASAKVLLVTDGRPLNARIEILQGPNNSKQVMEIYSEDGLTRPFLAAIETPGTGNTMRIINTATWEFPLLACVVPHVIEQTANDWSMMKVPEPIEGTGKEEYESRVSNEFYFANSSELGCL